MFKQRANKINLQLTDKTFYIPNKVAHSEKFTDKKKEFYTNNEKNFNLSEEEIKTINSIINVEEFGYEKI